MNKMTPQVLALYIGHRCQTSGGEGIIYSVNNDGIVQVEFGAMGPDFLLSHHIGHVKPILRRLESLTEGEARELYGVLHPSGWQWQIKEEFRTSVIEDYWHLSDSGVQSLMMRHTGHPPIWLKLLSLGFDLFGLIDAGLAIDASISKDAIAQ